MTIPDAGWYPDPAGTAQLRYWDGGAWTEHTAPQQTPATDPAPSPAPPAAAGDGPAGIPPSLRSSTLFARENFEAATTGRMTRQNRSVVKATLGPPLFVSRGAMIAFQGDVTFAYQGAGAKRFLKSAMTGEGVKLMRCEGRGELFVARHGRALHLLDLGPGERLSVSSSALLGFDATVGWDIEMIKGGIGGMAAGGLFNVTLTGPGTVVLATDYPVVLNTSEARTLVDPNAAVAWSAGLTITTRSSMSAGALVGRGSGEAFQLEFSPGGFVVVEPEPFTIGAG